MRIGLALLSSLLVLACGSPASVGPGGESEAAVTTDGKSAEKVIDACTQSAIGAAAADAFTDNNLQHLTALAVDGAPGVADGKLTYRVTTSNDEDGDTERTVVVEEHSGCRVLRITPMDGKMPSASDIQSAYKAVVDTCTMVAIDRAARKALVENNLQHLHGLALTDGDPAVEGTLSYDVTLGNDEDGDTDYTVSIVQKIDLSTGRSSCSVKSVTAKH